MKRPTDTEYALARRRLEHWQRILEARIAAGQDITEAWARVDGYQREVEAWEQSAEIREGSKRGWE